ncbi:MAG: recombinase family protein [Caproiciproducens sp.]|nr:recombinase family protein [Caproiciproducens sp.]
MLKEERLKQMRIAIYSRKSKYTGKGESIENQIEMCKEYIFSKIENVSKDDIFIYEDEGFSAKDLDRPCFQQMMKDAKQNPFDYIVCYRLDRISRSVSDFSLLIKDLNERGIAFICIKEEFDTTSPMGRAMMYIASVFAQLERETIAERVRDNMLMLSRTGRWLGGSTPTGFISEKVEEVIIDGKIKSSFKLKWDTNEIETAKMIYTKFMELHSISGVSKYLMKTNIKSRNGKHYTLLGIKDILSNPVYCIADKDARNYFIQKNSDVCFDERDCSGRYGLLSYNKRDYTRKSSPRLNESEWIIAIGKHQGIIAGRDWVAIQRRLSENKASNIGHVKTNNDYSLLSGLIICKKCGERMFAKQRSNSNGLFDYICSSKMRGGTELCDCQNLNGQQTDDLVCEHLMDYMTENSDSYRLFEKLKQEIESAEDSDPILKIEAKTEKLRRQIGSLLDSLGKPNISESLFRHIDAKVSELEQQINELEQEKRHLDCKPEFIVNNQLRLDAITQTLSYFKNYSSTLTIQEQRELIKLLVDKIEWDGANLNIFIYGE